jgi:DNA mismatch endonuclease (patch repair protein)
MRAIRRRDTKPELALRSELHKRGYRFRVDYPISTHAGRVRPDVVFVRRRVAVFIDGCFWHGCPEHGGRPKSNSRYWDAKLARNRERDQEQAAALTASGWVVVRVWEHEETPAAADRISAVIQLAQSRLCR